MITWYTLHIHTALITASPHWLRTIVDRRLLLCTHAAGLATLVTR